VYMAASSKLVSVEGKGVSEVDPNKSAQNSEHNVKNGKY